MAEEKPRLNKLRPAVITAVRRYCDAMRKADVKFQQVLVFGSQAKGTAEEYSDIDIAVVSDSFGHDYFDELGMLLKLRDNDLISIEPHPINQNDLNDRWSTFANEVRRFGIPINLS